MVTLRFAAVLDQPRYLAILICNLTAIISARTACPAILKEGDLKSIQFAAVLLIGIATTQAANAQENFGRFANSAKLEFVDNGPGKGRDMRLLEDLRAESDQAAS
jgi:hypothetical protein